MPSLYDANQNGLSSQPRPGGSLYSPIGFSNAGGPSAQSVRPPQSAPPTTIYDAEGVRNYLDQFP